MDETTTNPEDELAAGEPETPEDVAVLYTWANVHGGKYRDFSASRREFRAQQRHRMVEAQRQVELDAARDKEEAATRELAEARRVEEDTAADVTVDPATKAEAEETLRRAEEHAERERRAAQRHVDTAEDLKRAMEQAQREMEEARHRAEEQAVRWREADARWRALNGDREIVPGGTDDPYYYAGPMEPTAFAPGGGVRSSVPQRVSSERRILESYNRAREERRSGEASAGQPAVPGTFVDRRRPDSPGVPPTSGERRRLSRMVEPRIETPEDTRERFRQDERRRLDLTHGGEQFDQTIDDRYYDRDPGPKTAPPRPRSDVDPGSAPSALHIPPRTLRTRITDFVGDRSMNEDPAPGNAHAVDRPRTRRRESAADVTARTTRQPRESEQQVANSEDGGWGGRGTDTGIDTDRRANAEVPSAFRESSPEASAGRRADHPEWLVRNAAPAAEPATSGIRERGRYTLPREEEFTSGSADTPATAEHPPRERQIVRAADGGINLRPMTDRRANQDVAPVAEHRPLAPEHGAATDPNGGERPERRRYPRSGPGRESDLRYDASLLAENRDKLAERDRRAVSSEALAAPELRSAAARADQAESQPMPVLRSEPTADTLQLSRERVAARWFALKGLVGDGLEGGEPQAQPERSRDLSAPMVSIVSLSGGTGKTSLVATLGRALSSAGEKVLLADTTSHGLLPYYFGARALRPDVVRTFSPPPGSTDAPVYMVNYETDRLAADEAGQANLVEEIGRHSKGTQRVLLDLNGSSAWLARRLAHYNSSVLVPIAPDMNSVLSIQGVERFFAGAQDGEGRPVSPYYVLNQFDASLPLHLDVREVLRKQLGDRLLSVVIRRSHAVSEALAEGMTVLDYAPDSPVTEDYKHLADWVHTLAAPATAGFRGSRWSER